jgi:hypothetical protein
VGAKFASKTVKNPFSESAVTAGTLRPDPSTDRMVGPDADWVVMTLRFEGFDGIPLATTTMVDGPVSMDGGTSNSVDTGAVPVATPIVL